MPYSVQWQKNSMVGQMKTFYYVHTGHRIGLDRFRRAAAMMKEIQDIEEVTLLTSDYRIAHIAREFGIKNCVGIDVVRNIPNIAKSGDRLLFDSAEANPIMLEDMRNYFSTFIRISDAVDDKKEENEYLISPYFKGEGIFNGVIVDEKYFEMAQTPKTVQLSYFFGDDDYEKDLEKHFEFIEELDPALQLGFYYFLDYEDMLREKFSKTFDFEEYDEMIEQSNILLTASPQAVLDGLAAGVKVIYLQRKDYVKDFIPLFESLNIPVIYEYNKEDLLKTLKTIENHPYKRIEQISNKLREFIRSSLNL
jgi:hypothetical protein